ncbi:polysaccharide deacetylase family protein [Streptomyces mirabilis]|uniref:polysaccharide deacetylase family protein n=1 Tax=Streptomyces mirabilis TaxID=68239 RepID=UPI003631043F
MHATFFLLGSAAHHSPGVVPGIAAAAHEIGVHGRQHRPLLLRGPRAPYDRAGHTRVSPPHGDRGPRRRRHYPAARLGPHLGPRRLALGALPRILDTCTQRGYEVGPLCDHGQPVPDASGGNPLRPPIVYSYVDDRLCRSHSFLWAHRRQGMTARRMHQALESDPDPEAALERIIDRLPGTDEELLRQPLGNLPEER